MLLRDTHTNVLLVNEVLPQRNYYDYEFFQTAEIGLFDLDFATELGRSTG